jgi:F-type H+-transporting ATPase subunit b
MYNAIMIFVNNVPEGRVFALDSQTLISVAIQLLNGIILAVALGYILYKPVKKFMQARTEKIQDQIKGSEEKAAKADEVIDEYEAKIKEIDKERIQILENARHQAADEKKAILEEAKTVANEIKKHSADTALADEKRIKEESRQYIIELAFDIAQTYVTLNMDQQTQDRLFDEALAQMEGVNWQN